MASIGVHGHPRVHRSPIGFHTRNTREGSHPSHGVAGATLFSSRPPAASGCRRRGAASVQTAERMHALMFYPAQVCPSLCFTSHILHGRGGEGLCKSKVQRANSMYYSLFPYMMCMCEDAHELASPAGHAHYFDMRRPVGRQSRGQG